MRDADAAIRLSEYRPLDFVIDRIELDIRLDPKATQVRVRSHVRRVGAQTDLVLHGERQTLKYIGLDGAPLAEGKYRCNAVSLTIFDAPAAFVLEVHSEISPEDNHALEGLYLSGGRYCTQCEAEGFRKITYALDRPDSLSSYRVRIDADKATLPILLSNGNCVETGDLPDGRHFAIWEDPFPKPSYLFALVAGAYDVARDTFTTMSGRAVQLAVHVDPGEAPRARYALDALKRSMRWDEETFGREYDLDVFNIVAVRDFNFGAMENKGLNIFNAAYVLADADTATDFDFEAIESIVAHEYFHNWTGNRITCRDWFQLSLKEGLTVFRDQEFSADARSRPVQRIKDVKRLLARQFPEDAGPLAHPVRPSTYVKIDNFYTATVYEKGAEIIRMLKTLLGDARFRDGMDDYFARHDGQAVTIEDFVACFERAAGRDLSAFFGWYAQAGTPHVTARSRYDAAARRFTISVSQSTPATPGQSEKAPVPIPLRIGFIDEAGAPMKTRHDETSAAEHLVVLEAGQADITFDDVPRRPIPALMRAFSAPVVLDDGLSIDDRFVQMAHDTDAFTRWEAGQRLMRDAMLSAATGADSSAAFTAIVKALEAELDRADLDPAFAALALRPPDLPDLVQAAREPNPDALHHARSSLCGVLAAHLGPRLHTICSAASPQPFSPDASQAGRRALKSACIALLAHDLHAGVGAAQSAFVTATNMTESMAALEALSIAPAPVFDGALQAFYDRWRERPLVIDKWFSVQAGSVRQDWAVRLASLRSHADFTLRNPNRARALVMAFASRNLVGFHQPDGSGYRFLADAALETDAFNPALAARLLTPFESWRRFDAERQSAARAVLEQLRACPTLSANALEMIDRTLA